MRAAPAPGTRPAGARRAGRTIQRARRDGRTIERDRAVRIAYHHARHGRVTLAERWLELAGEWAEPTRRQREHLEGLIRAAFRAIPGQLDIEGREAT